MDKRYLQANKEARISLYLTFIYLASWTFFAYLINDKTGFFGFPAWFELSCIFTPIGFIAICYLVVKFFFKKIPLDDSTSKCE